jgi:hypothetical protein
MDDNQKRKNVILEIGPSDKPYAKLIVSEKRFGPTDRRNLLTYLAKDRRSGIADRRKKPKLK